MVQDLVTPLRTRVILGVKNMGARDLTFRAVACDDIVPAVTVEVPHTDFVAFFQLIENHPALPEP